MLDSWHVHQVSGQKQLGLPEGPGLSAGLLGLQWRGGGRAIQWALREPGLPRPFIPRRALGLYVPALHLSAFALLYSP